jgi:hypothetical protein
VYELEKQQPFIADLDIELRLAHQFGAGEDRIMLYKSR